MEEVAHGDFITKWQQHNHNTEQQKPIGGKYKVKGAIEIRDLFNNI